ncbi:MAG: hypothetical protein DRI30_01060 [Chloroflexi bacterium]|nr:MAG: hypothetical protein DRI30_01060 [Chloroflexota bacterium]
MQWLAQAVSSQLHLSRYRLDVLLEGRPFASADFAFLLIVTSQWADTIVVRRHLRRSDKAACYHLDAARTRGNAGATS